MLFYFNQEPVNHLMGFWSQKIILFQATSRFLSYRDFFLWKPSLKSVNFTLLCIGCQIPSGVSHVRASDFARSG